MLTDYLSQAQVLKIPGKATLCLRPVTTPIKLRANVFKIKVPKFTGAVWDKGGKNK